VAERLTGTPLDHRARDVSEIPGALGAGKDVKNDRFIGAKKAVAFLMRVAALSATGDDGVAGDSARLEAAGSATDDGGLLLSGTIAQAVYVGQGYRYRVRTAGGDVWVHAPDRLPEGAPACVVVPRDALLLFPLEETDKAVAGAMRPAA